jgi:uncharacterized protein YegJ (DUF2314 family)
MGLNKGYTFVDGVQMNKLHPDTFEIPDEVVRKNLKPGMMVKLIFKPRKKDGVEERMWVKVFRKRKDGVYEGVLDNEPLYELRSLLKVEDTVFFEPEHVVDVQNMK